MVGVFFGHFLRGFDYIIPLEVGEGAAGHLLGMALLVDRLLFDRAKWVGFGEAFVHGVLIEAATDGKDLGHGPLGHLVTIL
ncbi:ATPase component [Pseudomonas syringae pv. actinidiae]|uniref:ATPase component n=1 Tax=Pseudomonas syringae pv. actinidiae TaxID=103796 RepID=A0AAN4TLN5_PSESF|nr:ATPase component [Pseudomonas syringae pv. actinidiae]